MAKDTRDTRDIYDAVITAVFHGGTEELLHLGLKPEIISENDTRLVLESAYELIRDKRPINYMSIAVKCAGKFSDIGRVRHLSKLNGQGDVDPVDVAKSARNNFLADTVSQYVSKTDDLLREKPDQIAQWLPVLAQRYQSLTMTSRAYNPKPSAHYGSIVQPIMFRSSLPTYNKIWAGKAGDGGGYREGWWQVWIAPTGTGKTTH